MAFFLIKNSIQKKKKSVNVEARLRNSFIFSSKAAFYIQTASTTGRKLST